MAAHVLSMFARSDDEPAGVSISSCSQTVNPVLRATQVTLVGNAFVSFAGAFNAISELAILRRHSLCDFVEAACRVSKSRLRPVIDHLPDLECVI